MASRLQRLDVDLAKCYENDLDWNLLPDKLREVCTTFTLPIASNLRFLFAIEREFASTYLVYDHNWDCDDKRLYGIRYFLQIFRRSIW